MPLVTVPTLTLHADIPLLNIGVLGQTNCEQDHYPHTSPIDNT